MSIIDINDIPGDEIRNTLVKVVEKHTNSNKIKVCIEPGSKKGDNFVGAIFRVLYERADGSGDKSSLILKIPTLDAESGEAFNVRLYFLREIFMYEEVLTYFYELQLSKDIVPKDDGFNEYPKCYASLRTKMSECLLLEDLHTKQMEMLDHRAVDLTFEHVALVMEALGKFHALSFALKDQNPVKFAELISQFDELYYVENLTSRLFFDSLGKYVNETLPKLGRLDLNEKWENLTKDGVVLAGREVVNGKAAEPYAVICHGDAWINNCMYRIDSAGKPIAVNLIDWQFSRYASPVTDIVLNLICRTTKELRDSHFDDLLKVYHSSLSNFLKRLGSDPEKIFPYDVFRGEFKKFAKYAILVGSLLYPITSTDYVTFLETETTSVSEPMYNFSEKEQAKYDKKVIDTLDDLVRFSCL